MRIRRDPTLYPIFPPYLIFLLRSSELEVYFGNVLKAFLDFGLLEAGVEAVEGKLRE